MHVSPASVVRKLRQRGLFPKTPGAALFEKIPPVALSEIVDRPFVRIEGSYAYTDGSLPLCDLLALLSVLVDRSPQTVLEIGTFNGYTTRLMALNLPKAKIHTIDLPEDFHDTGTGLQKDDFHLIASRRVGAEFRADPSITTITQHFGDTAEYAFPPAEFFFIDGSHTYPYVRNDTEKALASPIAKVLMWHDCDPGHPDVNRWLVEMVQTGYPVRRIEGTNLAILQLQN